VLIHGTCVQETMCERWACCLQDHRVWRDPCCVWKSLRSFCLSKVVWEESKLELSNECCSLLLAMLVVCIGCLLAWRSNMTFCRESQGAFMFFNLWIFKCLDMGVSYFTNQRKPSPQGQC
jgi:hypothetical protein